MAEDKVVKRKPRANTLRTPFYWAKKTFFQYFEQAQQYGLPIIKFGLLPAMLAHTIYYAEAPTSLWELLNPLSRS